VFVIELRDSVVFSVVQTVMEFERLRMNLLLNIIRVVIWHEMFVFCFFLILVLYF